MTCQTTERPTLFRSRALWLHHMLATVSDDAHFTMSTFVERRAPEHSTFGAQPATHIGITASWPWCNTAGCIGGHIIMLGYTAEERASAALMEGWFSHIAAQWLGLDNSTLSRHFSSTLFCPGAALSKIKRHHAIDVVKNLYADSALWWRGVRGMASFDYGSIDGVFQARGDHTPVEWREEPDSLVGALFALRDRIRRSYWDGKGEQHTAKLDDAVPVCLLTGAGAVSRSIGPFSGLKEHMKDALRRATPDDMSFVSISDSGLDNAVELIDKAILIQMNVIPPVRRDHVYLTGDFG